MYIPISMRNIFFFITIFSIFSLNNGQVETDFVKIYQFDYINLTSPIGGKITPIFESIDYYLTLLFRKYEKKDYNYFYKMHYYMTNKNN